MIADRTHEGVVDRAVTLFIEDIRLSSDVLGFSVGRVSLQRAKDSASEALNEIDSWRALDSYLDLNVWLNESGVLKFDLHATNNSIVLHSFEFDVNQDFRESQSMTPRQKVST